MTFVTKAVGKKSFQDYGNQKRQTYPNRSVSLRGIYFGFQGLQIGNGYSAPVNLEHTFCL
jgi:hypothetical protein